MRIRELVRGRRAVAVVLLVSALLLAATYSALSVYKAIDYTTTPRQSLPTQTPATLGMPFEDVVFRSADDRSLELGGWWIPRAGSVRALVFVHGRNGNRASYLTLAQSLWQRGYNLLLIDLRGHGQSQTAASSYGLGERWDVIGAVKYARGRGFEAASIGVIGWSLGAASSLLALQQTDDIAALVSDSAYANADPLLADNLLRPGLRLAIRVVRDVDLDRVRPDRALANERGHPVLLIHGADDRAVPRSQYDILHEAGGANVTDTWVVPGVGHIGAYPANPDLYVERIAEFFDTHLT